MLLKRKLERRNVGSHSIQRGSMWHVCRVVSVYGGWTKRKWQNHKVIAPITSCRLVSSGGWLPRLVNGTHKRVWGQLGGQTRIRTKTNRKKSPPTLEDCKSSHLSMYHLAGLAVEKWVNLLHQGVSQLTETKG